MSGVETDVLVVGSGLGATAVARGVVQAGYRVVLVPGVGRTRSAHIDGGLVDAAVVESLFGQGAPLGAPVDQEITFRPVSPARFESDPPQGIASRRRYARQELESWAMQRVVADGATFLDDFVEGAVLPQRDGSAVLTSERDEREIAARVIVLCEGADPRIPLRVHLRPDYGPEDQLHFSRTLFHGEPVASLMRGTWRTSWGMPVEVFLIPQAGGTLVSVATRIENVMRASRSSKDALEELLASPAFESLGIDGQRGETGMELVALRSRHVGMAFVHDRLVMGLDFSGVIDPRRADRADQTMRAGRQLAAYLIRRQLDPDRWQADALAFVRDVIAPPAAYHDDRETGFLEEGSGGTAGSLGMRLAGLMRLSQRVSKAKR